MNYRVIVGTCEHMEELQDGSISCVFTSPPYALAKDYGDTGGIGMTANVDAYREYLVRMEYVLRECYRVLKMGRIIGINVADVIQNGERKPIRFDYHNILKKIGFQYKECLVWKKPDGMTTQRRFGVFIQNPFPTYYHPNNMYEPILVYKKPGNVVLTQKQKEDNTLNFKKFQKYQSDVWEFQPEGGVDHPAPFPYMLPQTFFELYSFKGETVLDPFLGSGSSMLAARNIRRNCVGYEINPDYVEKLVRARVGFAGSSQGTLTSFGLSQDDEFVVDVRKDG